MNSHGGHLSNCSNSIQSQSLLSPIFLVFKSQIASGSKVTSFIAPCIGSQWGVSGGREVGQGFVISLNGPWPPAILCGWIKGRSLFPSSRHQWLHLESSPRLSRFPREYSQLSPDLILSKLMFWKYLLAGLGQGSCSGLDGWPFSNLSPGC